MSTPTPQPHQQLHIEICLSKAGHRWQVEALLPDIRQAISQRAATGCLRNWRSFTPEAVAEEQWAPLVDRIMVGCSNSGDGEPLLNNTNDCPVYYYIYSLKSFGEMAQDLSSNGDNPSSAVIGSHQWELPCSEFDQLWDHLIYDDNLKTDLLNYVHALLRLSDAGANTSIIAVNRLVLLHGPPGTGKTTLCKALAQRLSIRLGDRRYKRSIFMEVNSHSLFSKWFSESGKLILKLFESIEELASQSNSMIFVLIDEVESLTIGRNAAFSGCDPSDSVRAVNAVLTQLDKIRRFPNVLVLSTSNISTAIDAAFIDRTDICRYVGNPSPPAVYSILVTVLNELQRIGAVVISKGEYPLLQDISRRCAGMSGRSIRKLPVLAYSLCSSTNGGVDLKEFIKALEVVVVSEQKGAAKE